MSYATATSYLLGTINETLSRRDPYRLERMERLLLELGNPQLQYATVHVGGTSGKGSTATMIAAILAESGLSCGLHTKPHLSSMRERARINGRAVSEDDFAEILREMMPAIERTTAELNRPTYYETLLALAFTYFARAEVDIAVIEVGIGGRLDGTNVIAPEVAVITNVGLDHVEILGSTIEEIALDKSGIIKVGIPIVTDAVAPARAIIAEEAQKVGAPFHSVRDEVANLEARMLPMGQHFGIRSTHASYDIEMPLLGAFQQRNVATAISAVEQLTGKFRPTKDAIENGLARVAIPGRMEYIPGHPSLIFDIAHNADKMQNLADALRSAFPETRLHFVIAISESKDAAQMLSALTDLPASFVCTSFETQGKIAIRPAKLEGYLRESGRWSRSVADPLEAFAVARRGASAEDIVVVTGSTVVVGTIRDSYFSSLANRAAQPL